MKPSEIEFLNHALQENGHIIAPVIQEQLLQYLHLMRKWNQVFNLTRICGPQEMIMRHILDSLSIGPYLHGNSILDVGTGAGLPGIPLALTQPDKSFVLLDGNSKKTRFLTQVVCDLKIKNVVIVQTRCEDFGRKDSGHECKTSPQMDVPNSQWKFDSILSRAFASLEVMLATTEHLISNHGQFLAMKGVKPEEELQAIPPGFKVLNVHKLTIKGLDEKRHLVCLGKEP